MENNTPINNDEKRDAALKEHRAEYLAELGVTEEQMTYVKDLLKANGYTVEDSYWLSVNPVYKDWNDKPSAYLSFSNELFYMTNSSSHWEFDSVMRIQAEVNKCADLLKMIKAVAPTLVDPTFRNNRLEQKKKDADAALKAKVDAWNAKPQKEVLLETPSGVKVTLERGTADFEHLKKYSRSSFSAGLTLKTSNAEERHFWPGSFITKAGSLQRKKFLESYGEVIGKDAGIVADDLVRLVKILAEAGRGDY